VTRPACFLRSALDLLHVPASATSTPWPALAQDAQDSHSSGNTQPLPIRNGLK
jgi:hypothetical protein